MYKCLKCGENAVGRSPTGSWCNNCGDMYPCPCAYKGYCPAHDKDHVHDYDENNGKCKTKDCPANNTWRRYQ